MVSKTRFSIFVLLWSCAFFLKRRMLIRINYKTGIQEEFWVYYFWKYVKASNDTTQVKWVPVTLNKPFMLGLNDVESIWIVEARGLFTMPESMEPK